MSRRLAIAIAVWTLLAWGGRIGLLVGGEGTWSMVRIGGSFLVGLMAVMVLTIPTLRQARRVTLIVFGVFTSVVWLRSLYVNLTGSGTLAFKLVHTVLALGFLALAVWSLLVARNTTSTGGNPVSGPDEGHREKQAQGEPTRFSQS